MTEDTLEARLRAVERALTDGDAAVADLSDAAGVHDRLDDLEAEVDALADRVDALDATVQSLHGYVGELEHVNERVERRADAARAAVERLEESPPPDRPQPRKTTGQRAGGEPRDDGRSQSGGDRGTGVGESLPDPEEPAADPDDGGDESLLDRVRESL